MEYRSLGRTGVPVSAICLGCMNFGGATPEDESIEIIHHALDNGVNFVDTANVYSRGISEEITGKGLKGKRDKVVLATKVHGRMADDDPLAAGNNARPRLATSVRVLASASRGSRTSFIPVSRHPDGMGVFHSNAGQDRGLAPIISRRPR